jgi:hypothetical protein
MDNILLLPSIVGALKTERLSLHDEKKLQAEIHSVLLRILPEGSVSNRSGVGLDGLQERCKTVVIGELDWAPGVHNQIIGRIDREGQRDQVTVYFPICDFGSDPVMVDILGIKSSQAFGIIDPLMATTEQFSDESRIKILAQSFLNRKK